MKISIKLKFSIFLGLLLLLTVYLLSLLVLEGIRKNQNEQLEQEFAQQASTANTYFIQTLLGESNKVPESFLLSKGKEFAQQLELITGQAIVLYDRQGTVLTKDTSYTVSDSMKKTLAFAQQNKEAYLTEKDSLYYMAPLRTGTEQVGVIQFYSSLAADQAFYNQIKQGFLTVGAGIFVVSFLLAYAYFHSFARGVIHLKEAAERIRQGNYARTAPLSRRDELGELSVGIEAMREQIKETIQQQKEFIGNVSHEFKTPLTSIRAYLDLLEMYPDDNSLLETAKGTIACETQRLYEMVEKVLSLSALEKYEFELIKETVEVRQVLLTVLASLQGKMEKFGLRLNTNLMEAYVEADKDSLTIVLVNLLDNAIKYNTPQGHINVICSSQENCVWIDIANTGIPIPEEVQAHIFDPFYTVDKNRARENGGTGLGLALARKYIEVQGGSLSLVKSDASGSLFRISMPKNLHF